MNDLTANSGLLMAPPKYAVIRLHTGDDVFKLFRLLIENGYPEVSFVQDFATAATLPWGVKKNSPLINSSEHTKETLGRGAGIKNHNGQAISDSDINYSSPNSESDTTIRDSGEEVADFPNQPTSVEVKLFQSSLWNSGSAHVDTEEQDEPNDEHQSPLGSKKVLLSSPNSAANTIYLSTQNSSFIKDETAAESSLPSHLLAGFQFANTLRKTDSDPGASMPLMPFRTAKPGLPLTDTRKSTQLRMRAPINLSEDSDLYVACCLCHNKIMASRLSNLTNHVRRHSLQKQFQCCYCEYAHNEMAKVRLHMLHNHRDRDSQPIDNISPEMQAGWELLMKQCFPKHYVHAFVTPQNHTKKPSASQLMISALAAEHSTSDKQHDGLTISPKSTTSDSKPSETQEKPTVKGTFPQISLEEKSEKVTSDESNKAMTIHGQSPKSQTTIPLDTHEFPGDLLYGITSIGTKKPRPLVSMVTPNQTTIPSLNYADFSFYSKRKVKDCAEITANLRCQICCKVLEGVRPISSLLSHAKRHYHLKQFHCTECPYNSSEAAHVRSHMKLKHAIRCPSPRDSRSLSLQKGWMQTMLRCFPSVAPRLKTFRFKSFQNSKSNEVDAAFQEFLRSCHNADETNPNMDETNELTDETDQPVDETNHSTGKMTPVGVEIDPGSGETKQREEEPVENSCD